MPNRTKEPNPNPLAEVELVEEGSTAGFATAPLMLINLGEIREDAIPVFKERLERFAMLLARDLNAKYSQPDAVPQLVGYNIEGLGTVHAWALKPRNEAREAAAKRFDEYVETRKEAASKVAAKRPGRKSAEAATEIDVG